MIVAFITFRYGNDFTADKVHQLAQNSRAMFEGMPGLRSKLFSVSPESREARNVYVLGRRELGADVLHAEDP